MTSRWQSPPWVQVYPASSSSAPPTGTGTGSESLSGVYAGLNCAVVTGVPAFTCITLIEKSTCGAPPPKRMPLIMLAEFAATASLVTSLYQVLVGDRTSAGPSVGVNDVLAVTGEAFDSVASPVAATEPQPIMSAIAHPESDHATVREVAVVSS